jgi:hypothetical protein
MKLASMRQRWMSEGGSATVEHALLMGALLGGAGIGVFGFVPVAFEAYERYLAGILLVLGLPFP